MKASVIAVIFLSALWALSASNSALAADVYLLNTDGRVWLNGQPNNEISTKMKIQAAGLAGSSAMKEIIIVNSRGELFINGNLFMNNPAARFPAASCRVVGKEPYILNRERGEVWRFFREKNGGGVFRREDEKSLPLALPSADFAVVGPPEDKADRTVYILTTTGKVFINSKENKSIAPQYPLTRPAAIDVEHGVVYVLDGANGKVYANGKYMEALSRKILGECVDMAVKDGICYILDRDGTVHVNGKKEPSLSSNVKSEFVALFVR